MKKSARTRSRLVGIMLVLAVLYSALIGPVTASPAMAGTGPVGGLTPMTPTRILDTRTSSGPVPGGGSVSIRIPGTNGFPYGTQAVVLNITATDATAAGFLTAHHSGVMAPRTSNVNYGPGQMVANLAIVEVGADGQIAISNTSTGTVQIVVDASAYFAASGPQGSPGSYQAVGPARLLDTRTSSGPIAGGGSVPLRLGGSTGVPTDASAVVVNLTVTESTSYGFITAYPSGSLKPNVSNQNYGTGQTVPNLAVVPVGPDGTVTIANTSSGTAQIIADVVGFFLPGTPTISGAFARVSPVRLVDTRTDGGPVVNAGTVPVQVVGVNGIPQNASGVWVNLTVTEPTTFGYFMARGYRAPWTFTSNLNFSDRQTIANMAYVPIGADGKVEIQTILSQHMINWTPVMETSQVIVDVFGYTLP
ncbi:hypothetical protein OOZ51_17170 [Arthrobacter sp. MI7-26]|uniref:hypothetical protein n=1 Tax=Arthrobacter sp. MI7-26 TaxID=2993653 RepID=UPI002248D677|nr:hypothetical protein [Arthrobacter sp. MI7-26]MCX2749530.1 hypothetical protein [Arthrobacter sp. MI7-26]